jgi:hypothetical protein
MEGHWGDVLRTFDALAYLVKEMDSDGIELRFVNSCSEDGQAKHRTPLRKRLDKVKPGGQCDMGIALNKILPRCYPDQVDRRSSWLKRPVEKAGFNIYILTDGVWSQGEDELCGVQKHIQILVKKLIKSGKLKRVGIQFIRFGDDPAGKERLRRLDDELLEYDIERDIVDTEPANGNIFKMLLGSTSSTWDQQHNN